MELVKTKHFSVKGDTFFSCPCCGVGGLAPILLIVLEHLRAHFNAPVVINSGARCVAHNIAEGGAEKSLHIVTPENPLSLAADVRVVGVKTLDVYNYLLELPYSNLLGLGLYNGRVHVDVRGTATRWVVR